MSWFNISSVTSIHPSIHSNCPPCLYFVVLFFYVLHVVANNEALWAGSMSFCVLCVCATFVLALHVSHVCLFVCLRVVAWSQRVSCQLLSGIRLIWRGWTGDGRWGASSAGSRAEVNWDRRCIASPSSLSSLLLLFSSPHLTCCLLSHGSTRPSSHAHTCSAFHPVSSSSKCIYHEPHNPPRLTTNRR